MSSLSPPSQPWVLVVDDEQSIREMLAEFLEMEGYGVETAADGLAALAALESRHFDVVLSDLKMPKMGGITLVEQMKKHAPNTKGIIMTGFGTVETAINAMKGGAYDYLLKPFKLAEVIHVVQRAVQAKRMAAENIRLRQSLSLYKVSEAISTSLSLDQVMQNVIDSSMSELNADLISIWLDDGEGKLFERERTMSDRHPLGQHDVGELAPKIIVERLNSGEPLLVHAEDVAQFFEGRGAAPMSSFVAVALRVKGRLLGFVAVATANPSHRFEEGERKLLSIIASRAAAAIENAKLYRDLQDTFQQTIEGLASAVDKMDRYTAGHSARVAEYAVKLARRLDLNEDEVEIVRQSALMHDIGKIGCVMNLNKPSTLTADEYEAFKLHPVYGKDILSPIKFLHPLIPGVYMHHERFDGRGYPLGLKGTKIPLMARIISVADAYDAMTSDRSYRRAMPHDVAVSELSSCAGGQFDPDIAATFLDEIAQYRKERRERGEPIPD